MLALRLKSTQTLSSCSPRSLVDQTQMMATVDNLLCDVCKEFFKEEIYVFFSSNSISNLCTHCRDKQDKNISRRNFLLEDFTKLIFDAYNSKSTTPKTPELKCPVLTCLQNFNKIPELRNHVATSHSILYRPLNGEFHILLLRDYGRNEIVTLVSFEQEMFVVCVKSNFRTNLTYVKIGVLGDAAPFLFRIIDGKEGTVVKYENLKKNGGISHVLTSGKKSERLKLKIIKLE